MASKSYKITSGPSKFDLMTSLFVGDCHGRHNVQFQVEGLDTCTLTVNRVQREAGSGESWNIEGYGIESQRWWVDFDPNDPTARKFKIYYSTRTRQGTFTLFD